MSKDKTSISISCVSDDIEAYPVAPAPVQNDLSTDDWNEDPRKWSTLKKAAHVIPPALLCMSVTAGASMIVPGIFEIEAKFGVSRTKAILGLSLFVLGLAVGPIFAAPISEKRGRSIVYKVTFPLYMLFIMGAGLANTFSGLLACRMLAAMTGAPCLAVAAGTIADLFEPWNMVPLGSLIVMAPFLGPCLGPIIGGFVATYKGYQWTQYCTVLLALVAYLTVLPTQETHRKVLLKRRAAKLGLPSPVPELAPREAIKLLLTIVIFRPIKMLFCEPIVLLFSLYNSFTFSVLFSFFEAFPYVFIKVYGFNLWQFGLTFLSVGLGVLLGCVLANVMDRFIYQRGLAKNEKGQVMAKTPEERLYLAMVGAVCLPIGLFWFAFTAKESVHWIVPVLSGIPFAMGNVSVFMSAAVYMLDVYGEMSGASAMAANGLLRYTIGAAFPLFTVQMYEQLGIAWATGLLGMITLCMLPIPFVFYRFGPAIRNRSRFAVDESS